MTPKKILQKYQKIGYAQFIPAIVCLLFVVWVEVGLGVFFFIIVTDKNDSAFNNFHVVGLGIVLLIVSILVLGIFSIIISSFQFIKSKENEDYEKIVKGMVYLNRGWISLLLFWLILVSFISYALYSFFIYGYF